MPPRVCISASVSWGNRSGGHPWLYLSWALGLQEVGCDVVWLEAADEQRLDAGPAAFVSAVRELHRGVGLAADVALCAPDGTPLPWDGDGDYLSLADAAADADLYLNLAYNSHPSVVARFRRSAFVDQDPGALQLWLRDAVLELAPHDVYFTVGETVGRPGSRVPDCGLRWLYTPLPVALDPWPVQPPANGAPYTTVSNWWGRKEWIELDGQPVSNEKRTAFLEFLELPRRTGAPLELALTLGPWDVDLAEQRLLEEHGWFVRRLWDVEWGPDEYRDYVQRSRGEFSCAKPLYVRLETGMLHDRTLHYLASGKPAVVQHTGPSRILPDAEGIFRFRTVEEAARALERVEADYERQCRLARALVEEHFAAPRVVTSVLERALT